MLDKNVLNFYDVIATVLRSFLPSSQKVHLQTCRMPSLAQPLRLAYLVVWCRPPSACVSFSMILSVLLHMIESRMSYSGRFD